MTNMPDENRPGIISPQQVGVIANQVRALIRAGEENAAWETLQRLHPADMGTILASLPRSGRDSLLRVMDPETVTWMLRQMNPLQAGRVAARLGSQALSGVLEQVNPGAALGVLLRINPLHARQVSQSLEQPLADTELLAHRAGTAGSLMVPQFPSAPAGGRVSEALASLRDLGENRHEFNRVYAVEEDGSLAGQLTMTDLALLPERTPVREVMDPVPATVTPDTPAWECARLLRHYNVLQLPVMDDGRLVGVIPLDFLLGAVVQEDTREMLNVGGVSGGPGEHQVYSAIRTRLPWLTINLGTTFLAAAVISLFESTLAQVVILAAFLPVVAGQGGIGGTQTLTMIVRSIALGELVGVNSFRLLAQEAFLGLLHGVWLGVLVGAVGFLWTRNPGLALVLGVAMVGNMVIAGLAGAGVPLFLRRIGIDPAVASAVVVTTFTDVFGFLLFLGIATAAISLLV